uniref:Holin n=1 Tax=Siphoviridae sp. ctnFo11 TaxID=2826454 RepID=A0A8S5N4Q9_9CAUD|nr:MAG TPA: holin [Siphoviridae sp. ctnFo11]
MFKNCVFKVSVDTQKWMKAAAVRAVKTMAQVAGSMLVIGAFNETAWSLLIQTSLAAGLASVLTSITGIPEVKDGE